ncbi:MAG: glycosyltransferase [Ginsengibacter sp.]
MAQNKLVSCVEIFPAQTIFLAWYEKTIFNKVIHRISLSQVLRKINRKLKIKIDDFNPDVLLIFKGMEIFPSTLKWVKAKGIKLASYNPDNPFIFSGRGSGNSHLSLSIPLYDLFLSYDTCICAQMEKQYHVTSKLLPFGYDVSEELFTLCTHEPEREKVCFVGNMDKNRLHFLNELSRAGVKMDLYGMNWNKASLEANIIFKGPVFEDDLWKTLRSYRVQLNLMRIHNPDSHNMRTFEIGGIGGVQLAPDTTDHKQFFENGKEIFLYSNLDSCIREIRKILDLSTEEANKVRLYARNKSTTNGYSYKDRAATLAFYLKELVNG